MLASDRQLCVGEFERGALKIEVRQTVKPRMVVADPLQCFRLSSSAALEETFRLLLVLLDVGAGWKAATGTLPPGVVEESPPAAAPTTITALLDPASHRDDENTQAPVEIIERATPKGGRGRKKTPARKAAGKTPTRAGAPSEGAGAAKPAARPRRPRAKKAAASTAEG